MKIKLVTLSTETENSGWLKFKATLDRFGYDYHLIHQDAPSGAHIFGTQMPLVYEYLKSLQGSGYTHVIYADAWDSIAMAGMDEVLNKLPNDGNIDFWGSTEKACFPHPELASEYPDTLFDWKYVNGGGWLASIDFFIKIYDESPAVGVNDQLWLTQQYLKHKSDTVLLDTNCKVFQTVGFEGEGDFSFEHEESRLGNNKTSTRPIILHGNGRTPLERFWELVKV